MTIDTNIIAMIIRDEKEKKLKQNQEYGERAVLYDMPPEEVRNEEEEEESQRGVVVIDI
jgi:hypothetical protein